MPTDRAELKRLAALRGAARKRLPSQVASYLGGRDVTVALVALERFLEVEATPFGLPRPQGYASLNAVSVTDQRVGVGVDSGRLLDGFGRCRFGFRVPLTREQEPGPAHPQTRCKTREFRHSSDGGQEGRVDLGFVAGMSDLGADGQELAMRDTELRKAVVS